LSILPELTHEIGCDQKVIDTYTIDSQKQ